MTAIYDDPDFFKAYSQMDRSKKGLAGAGEWHELKTVLPDFTGNGYSIWGVAMGGTVDTPLSMGPKRC